MTRIAAAILVALFANAPALAASSQMAMPMPMADKPATFPPTLQAWTTDHRFLVKLTSVPKPIPYQKYFALRFAVFDRHGKPLPDADLQVDVGMRHGLAHGFAHGMQSAPKIAAQNGAIDVSGLYFHMLGAWTLKATVHAGGQQGTAYFQLPCCGQ